MCVSQFIIFTNFVLLCWTYVSFFCFFFLVESGKCFQLSSLLFPVTESGVYHDLLPLGFCTKELRIGRLGTVLGLGIGQVENLCREGMSPLPELGLSSAFCCLSA